MPAVKKLIKCLTLFCGLILNGLIFANPNSNEGIQVYQKNLHFSPEKKQNLAKDINRYHNADNIWNMLRKHFTLPHYENNPLVQEKINWFMNHQDYLMRSMTRAAPYLYFILQQVKKRHLPAELVLLPIIESAYNPFALNASSGAAGMWQMMSATASGYGIRQNWYYDGRRDAVASTQAALNHLAYLKSFFEGNWLLAIAAYDTGEGNVLAAIRKNITNGENTDFWSLPVAQETRDYVPQLLALAIIISHPDEYPIQYPLVPNAPYLAQVDVGAQIDLKEAAALAGLSTKELKQLNSGYNRSTTDPNGPFKIFLPIENVEEFTTNLARSSFYERRTTYASAEKNSNRYWKKTHKSNLKMLARVKPSRDKYPIARSIDRFDDAIPSTPISEPTAPIAEAVNQALTHQDKYIMHPGDTLYIVRDNDTLDRIANRFHVDVTLLAKINQFNQESSIHSGQSIIIPTHKENRDQSQQYALTPGDTIYMVRQGDTIEKIAEKFHTTPAAVRLANLLSSNKLETGDQLVIPTHV